MNKTIKKTIAMLISGVLVLNMLPFTASAVDDKTATASTASTSFSDVSSGDWFYDATNFVVENGLFQGTGDGKFSPGAPMTRGMFVTVLGRLDGVDKTSASYQKATFSDVSQNAYYGPYVAWASGEGIVTGTGGTSFSPDKELSRQDLMTVLYRYQKYKGGSTALGSSAAVSDLSDRGDISTYASDAMSWGISNSIINGVGGGKLSPRISTTRAQVAKILYSAYSLLKANGTASSDFGKDVNTVSATFKDKLTGLTSGGKTVSSAAVMSEMYTAAEGLVKTGEIKDLTYDEQGVYFSYADGTPGGIVMELPEVDAASASALSVDTNAAALLSADETTGATVALSSTAQTTAVSTSSNVIGNNKVLLSVNLDDVWGNDFENYEALKDKFKANTRGLEVTVKDLTVADYKTLNNYGAVFISNPTSWSNDGTSCIELMEDYDASKNYEADRQTGRIGVYSKLSPGSNKYIAESDGYILSDTSFNYELRYVLFPEKFFSYYYGSSNTFPNSFIHLGFDSSISMSKLSNILIGAGAGCVTGYTDALQRQTDFSIIGTMMDTLLKAEKNTVYDAYLAVLDKKLGTDKFTYTYYKNLKWDIVSREVESIFDMRLNNDNGELKLWGAAPQATGTGLTLSNCTYSTSKGSFGSTKYNVKGTITNNTNDIIRSVYLCYDVMFDPKIEHYLEGYLAIGFGTNTYLQPGESRNFELTKELYKDTGYFELIITDYYTKADNNVRIPVADYVQVPCTKT